MLCARRDDPLQDPGTGELQLLQKVDRGGSRVRISARDNKTSSQPLCALRGQSPSGGSVLTI